MTFGVIARELGRRRHNVTVFRPARPELDGRPPEPEFEEVALSGWPIPGYGMLRLGLPAGAELRRRLGAAAAVAMEGQSWGKVLTGFETELNHVVAASDY